MEEIDAKICLEYKTAMSLYSLHAKSFRISLKDIEIYWRMCSSNDNNFSVVSKLQIKQTFVFY